jgi:hypothetical protein
VVSRRQLATTWQYLLYALALCWASSALPATISASVDRSSVSVDESFHLVLEVDGDIDVDPDLSPLAEKFEVLNQSRSQNVSIINGRATRQNTWQIELMPTQPGSVTIPAIEFGSARSNPVTVLVRPSGPPGEGDTSPFFLEVEVDEERPYVQQQVVYTVRVFRTTKTSSARLSEPAPEGVDTIVERLGKDSVYVAHRAGQRYRVTERRYAIFPQGSGMLVLPPLRFQAEVIERGRSRSSIFDTARTRSIRVRSKAIEVPVAEAPAEAPRVWLPARSLSLGETWSSAGPVTAGDALTRRITIRASGLIAAQLPELNLALPEAIKQYPEQPELKNLAGEDGVMGTRIQTTALVATRPGTYTLPAVTVTWWNVETRQPEQAVLPSRILEVTAGAPAAERTAPLDADNLPDGGGRPLDDSAPSPGYWRWLSVGLALAWLLTLGLWRRDRRLLAAPAPSPREGPPPSVKKALADLKRACADNDAAAARDAALALGTTIWPEAPPGNLSQLAGRCGGALSAAIDDLQRALYAPQPAPWEGPQLWLLARHLGSRDPEPVDADAEALVPLHKAAVNAPGRG